VSWHYNPCMAIYDQYAKVYDDSGQVVFSLKMIPYLGELLQRHPAPGQSMLDLACGTGTVALSFAHQGWEVYGVDASSGMLDQARQKAEQAGQALALSQQDMRQFILPHPVTLVTCLYDSLNYMLKLAELERVFQQVARALTPGGVFLADMNTRVTLEQVWGNNTFFVENDELAVIMRSHYEPLTGLSTVDIVGFVRESDGLYSRFDEHHAEVAYPNDEVGDALQEAGLVVEAAYKCFHFDPPDAHTRRVMWVARKPGGRE
jgi:ubiquinone/menaquinone biosynthesis C-methylase UbiE